VKLFIITLLSMCVIAFAIALAGSWFLLELVRFYTYCSAQGGRC
jgi:hypothetical protein